MRPSPGEDKDFGKGDSMVAVALRESVSMCSLETSSHAGMVQQPDPARPENNLFTQLQMHGESKMGSFFGKELSIDKSRFRRQKVA